MNIIFICMCIFFIVIISQIRPGDGFKLSRNAEARLAGAGNTQNTQALSEGQSFTTYMLTCLCLNVILILSRMCDT